MGRTYFAKRVVNEDTVLEIVNEMIGKKNIKRIIIDYWLRIICFLQGGHKMVTDVWKNGENPNWRKEKDFEYHIGCKRCPEFRTEKP